MQATHVHPARAAASPLSPPLTHDAVAGRRPKRHALAVDALRHSVAAAAAAQRRARAAAADAVDALHARAAHLAAAALRADGEALRANTNLVPPAAARAAAAAGAGQAALEAALLRGLAAALVVEARVLRVAALLRRCRAALRGGEATFRIRLLSSSEPSRCPPPAPQAPPRPCGVKVAPNVTQTTPTPTPPHQPVLVAVCQPVVGPAVAAHVVEATQAGGAAEGAVDGVVAHLLRRAAAAPLRADAAACSRTRGVVEVGGVQGVGRWCRCTRATTPAQYPAAPPAPHTAPPPASPRAQHCCVTGSHSPSVQHVRPHTNSRLQQPLVVHACPGPQHPPPPACETGQHAPPTQAKPSGQHSAPQTREDGQQRLAWQDSQDWQHSMPQRMLLGQAGEGRGTQGVVEGVGAASCGGG
jgi:hypothetical protein